MSAQSLKDIVCELIRKSKAIGSKVVTVTCDMGPRNHAMWREFRIEGSRDSIVDIAEIDGEKMSFMADVPHCGQKSSKCFPYTVVK